MSHNLPGPLVAVLAVLVLIAAFFDIRTRKIPNQLTVGGLLAGLVLHAGLGGWTGLRTALLGAGLGLLVFLPPYLLRGTGAGDVKLMGAVGALAGPLNTFGIFLLTALFGGILAILLLLWKGGLRKAFRNVGFIVTELASGRPPHQNRPDLTLEGATAPKLPYAIPIALGTLVFLSL